MVEVPIEEARAAAVARLVRDGVPAPEAEIAATICLEAELRGKRTHGFIHLRNNLIQYHAADDRRRDLTIERETPSSALVDGGFHFSYSLHQTAMSLAIKKARVTGLAMVGARNGGASGPLGYYTQLAAEAGLVGIACNSAPVSVVPPGGTRAILSTNPLSVGVPRPGGPPLILDMATSAGTFNLVVLAQRTGTPLPAGMAVDAAGEPTTDPFAAVEATGRPRLLPFGGHKGFGLAFMIELLCGASLGTPIGEEKRAPFIHEPAHFTGLYLAYRPDLFVPREEFDDRVAQLVRDVKASAADPNVVVRLPGEESQRRKARVLERGSLELDEATWEFLTS